MVIRSVILKNMTMKTAFFGSFPEIPEQNLSLLSEVIEGHLVVQLAELPFL